MSYDDEERKKFLSIQILVNHVFNDVTEAMPLFQRRIVAFTTDATRKHKSGIKWRDFAFFFSFHRKTIFLRKMFWRYATF